jgi:hypothetical protein
MIKGKPSRRDTMDVQYSGSTRVVGLRADLNRMIGEQLRLIYRETVVEEVPERLVMILKRLNESKDGDPHE